MTETTPATLDPTHTGDEAGLDERRSRLGLVVTWSRDNPALVGAFAWAPEALAPAQFLGREDDDDTAPRLAFRLGEDASPCPIASRRLSRRQLRLEALDHASLAVDNLGRRDLSVDGQVTTHAVIRAGSVLTIERTLQLLVVSRTLGDHLDDGGERSHTYGERDVNGLIGESEAIRTLRAEIAHAASHEGHVLIVGPEGAGKELVARAVHARSSRGKHPLVARAVATIPDDLLEAELFGSAGRPPSAGLVTQADGSSLLLDEIGANADALAAQLGRFLDAGTYHPLGGASGKRADVRVIATTRLEPDDLPRDLVNRVRFSIRVPALSGRSEDIPLLIRAIVADEFADDEALATRLSDPETGAYDIDPGFVAQLIRHPLEGGMRTLARLVRRAIAGSTGRRIEAPDGLTTKKDTARQPVRPLRAPASGALPPDDVPTSVRVGLSELTKTEVIVMQHLALNKTSREIASGLFVSVRTVQNHRARICNKLELHGANRLLGVALALADMLGPPPPTR